MQSLDTGIARTIGPGAIFTRSGSTAAGCACCCPLPCPCTGLGLSGLGRFRRRRPCSRRQRRPATVRAGAACRGRSLSQQRGPGTEETDSHHRHGDRFERAEPHGGKYSVGDDVRRRRDDARRRFASIHKTRERLGPWLARSHRAVAQDGIRPELPSASKPGRGSDTPAHQPLAEQLSRPRQPASDRAFSHAELMGGLRLGQTLQIADDDRRSIRTGASDRSLRARPAQARPGFGREAAPRRQLPARMPRAGRESAGERQWPLAFRAVRAATP